MQISLHNAVQVMHKATLKMVNELMKGSLQAYTCMVTFLTGSQPRSPCVSLELRFVITSNLAHKCHIAKAIKCDK